MYLEAYIVMPIFETFEDVFIK